ncbi:MAG: hypothetical protein MUQ32_09355 [Chloroflexi bacterium]|nr:hypothetical protein [Chloroflexota bacterium]
MVVVAALAPVIISRYDIAGHELWLVCSLVALVLLFGVWIVNYRTPETREATISRAETVREVAANSLLLFPTMTALVLVVLGLFPDHEPALQLTAVGLTLFLDALTLLFLVFKQRRPQTPSDPAPLPAPGGASA